MPMEFVGNVCEECVTVLTYTMPPEDLDEAIQKQYTERLEQVLSFCGHYGMTSVPDEELGFSWDPCDCCKTTLGGNRYTVYGWVR